MFLISLRYSERFPGLVGTFSYPQDCEGYKNEAGIISDSSGPVLGSKKQMERKTKVSLIVSKISDLNQVKINLLAESWVYHEYLGIFPVTFKIKIFFGNRGTGSSSSRSIL